MHLVECHQHHPMMLNYVHKLIGHPFADASAFQGRMLPVRRPEESKSASGEAAVADSESESGEDLSTDASSEISLVSASVVAGAAAIRRLSLDNP